MFFAVLIPAYKCDNTIDRLLESVIAQNEEDLEVIISDDNGNDDLYHNHIKKFEDRLKISYYLRADEPYKCHCPGNTRHDLLTHVPAGTQYVTFIDCDDEFEPNTFKGIKEFIIENNYPNEIFSPFYEYDFITGEKKRFQRDKGWLHGNFYKHSFLKKYDIQFKIDLRSHEDVYFNSLVGCCLAIAQTDSVEYSKECIYKWYFREDSESHYEATNGAEYQFIETYLNDYLEASILPSIHMKTICPENTNLYFQTAVSGLLAGYFYFQGSLYNLHYGICKVNYENYKEMVRIIMKAYAVTKEDIIKTAYYGLLD